MLPGDTLMWAVNEKHLHPEDLDPSPESQDKNLVAAVVQRAIEDLEDGDGDPVVQQDAFWWLFVDEGERVMSLAWCCEVLDVTRREVRLRAEALYPRVCWRLAGVVASRLVEG